MFNRKIKLSGIHTTCVCECMHATCYSNWNAEIAILLQNIENDFYFFLYSSVAHKWMIMLDKR